MTQVTNVAKRQRHGEIPVVATAGVGIEDAGGRGVRYAPVDSVNAYADAVASVFSDEQETARLRDLGRQHAAQFTWRRSAELLRAAIDAAMSSSSES